MSFDKFSSWCADRVASAPFFAFCVLTVVLWFPSILIVRNIDTWQLIINTFTTIVTFLLVALLHNDQNRFEKATNARLEEIVRTIEGAHDPVDDDAHRVRDRDNDRRSPDQV